MAVSLRAVSSNASIAEGADTCAKPTGTAAGDLLLAFQSADLGTLAQIGTPTGGTTWQLLASRASGTDADLKTKIWWKIAGSSEPATYGFTWSSISYACIAIAALQGAGTSTPVVAQTGNDVADTTVPTPSGTPTGSDDLELRWGAASALGLDIPGWTPPATYTKQVDITAGEYPTVSLATKVLTSSAATGSLNFATSSSVSYRHGFTVDVASAISPAPRAPVVMSQAAIRASRW
ncbi:hypothetical protein [Streptosporangium sp. NPDC051022]|uniref:hypothetical protein n=1 Tax=Streptosporangium sp. NPDC051022 TaxID=3155752 RepID=UPI00342A925C